MNAEGRSPNAAYGEWLQARSAATDMDASLELAHLHQSAAFAYRNYAESLNSCAQHVPAPRSDLTPALTGTAPAAR